MLIDLCYFISEGFFLSIGNLILSQFPHGNSPRVSFASLCYMEKHTLFYISKLPIDCYGFFSRFSRRVHPRRAKTVVAVWQITNTTNLNVFVKKGFYGIYCDNGEHFVSSYSRINVELTNRPLILVCRSS